MNEICYVITRVIGDMAMDTVGVVTVNEGLCRSLAIEAVEP